MQKPSVLYGVLSRDRLILGIQNLDWQLRQAA